MKATIDKAGRIVIPAAIRARAGLKPGTEVKVLMDDLSIRLIRVGADPVLVREGGRLIARPTAGKGGLPEVDLEALVEEERNRWPW
ncbi:MAG: AbrB/MazE/SpoVT family DNA-binding domain-containing protein [Acidobacteriota bacterium]|jgi:AbrB family looped-hinge helix DNA binding protein|nr:AbrB/MazE/SpoVT family DNA-binding domain-containing protein [Acidobacteriota bacterium]NLT32547.1 AbrB/MazE/SpoVT family DNA-binding domain-containing protein [Acidobacteriota bacterium]